MPEKQRKCEVCGEIFILRAGELDYLQRVKREEPQYCPICRRLQQAQREAERKAREDAEWRRQKEKAHNLLVFLYNSRIRKYDIDSGLLVYNRPARRTFEQTHRGEDLTGKLRNIYRTGFH